MKTHASIALIVLLLSAVPGLCFPQALPTRGHEEHAFSFSPLADPLFMADERAYVEPLKAPLFVFSGRSPIYASLTLAQSSVGITSDAATVRAMGVEGDFNETPIPDPFEPLNRAAFVFNDGFYFWFLKPVTVGYKAVVQEPFRVGFRNAFYNLVAPVHIFNCMFQGKFKGAGNETARFFINTTFGLLGFFDQAKDKFNIDKCDEDLGQTFGAWGFGPGFYIEWPFFGSSTLRDTAGFVGDMAFDPRTYIFNPLVYFIRPIEVVNDTSFRIGDYEALKNAALDPYVAKKEAYHQYRLNKIKE